MARPSNYTQKIADEICERLAEGESLRNICKTEKMPNKATVFRWLANPEYRLFRDQYAYAREAQTECLADELVDIADDGSNDYMTINKGNKSYNIENREVVNRSRLRIETREWIIERLIPKKYGLKTTLWGDPENPLVPIIKDDI